jgi:hypothetical protein
MKSEPVLVLLNGIAAVVSLVLIALVALDSLSWTPAQITAVVAAIEGGANLIAAVVRSAVYSPASAELMRATGNHPSGG